MKSTGRIIGIIVMLAFVSMFATGCYSKPENGKTNVILDDGPLEAAKYREIQCPKTGQKYTGAFSQVHSYPTSELQRFYNFDRDKNRSDYGKPDSLKVNTADGVEVTIKAQIAFKTVFDCSKDGKKALKKFDALFGPQNRKFTAVDGSDKNVWDGDDGWVAFLNEMARPVFKNTVREQVSNYSCAELVNSCALVQSGRSGDVAKLDLTAFDNTSSYKKLEKDIAKDIEAALDKKLDGAFLVDFSFTVTDQIRLPKELNATILKVQKNFADLSKSRAAVTKAELDNLALRKKAETFQKYPVMAQIEIMRNLPKGSSVYVGMDPQAVTVTGNK